MRELLERIGTVVGILAAVGAVIAGVRRDGRRLWRLVRGLMDLVDDWRGEPERPGVPGRPGVMVRLGALETGQATLATGQAALQNEVAKINAELHPDSGRTFRDAVDRAVAAAAASKGERS